MGLSDCHSYEDLSAFALGAFGEFKGQLEENRLEFEKQNIRSRGLFERLLGFQRFLSNAASVPRLSGSGGGRPQDASGEFSAETYTLLMLGYNIQYMLPAVQALEQNLMTVYENLVRSVVESIPKSFYIMARPSSAKNFRLIDMYSGWVSENSGQKHRDAVEEFLQLPEPQKLLGEQITPNQFGELCKKHSAGHIRKRLYVDEDIKTQAVLYAHLNSSSHSSTIRPSQLRRDPEQSAQFMDLATELSFFNLFLLVNSQSRTLEKLGLWEKSELFVKSAANELYPCYRTTNLYPKAEYTKNLIIQMEPLK